MTLRIAMVEDQTIPSLADGARGKVIAKAEAEALRAKKLILEGLAGFRSSGVTPDMFALPDTYAWSAFAVPIHDGRDLLAFALVPSAWQPRGGRIDAVEGLIQRLLKDGQALYTPPDLREIFDEINPTVTTLRAECIAGLQESGMKDVEVRKWELESHERDVWDTEPFLGPILSPELKNLIAVASFLFSLGRVGRTALETDLPIRFEPHTIGRVLLQVLDVRSMERAIHSETADELQGAVERFWRRWTRPTLVADAEDQLRSNAPEETIIEACPASRKMTFGARAEYMLLYLAQAARLQSEERRAEGATVAAPDTAGLERVIESCRSLAAGLIDEAVIEAAINAFSLDEPHRLREALDEVAGNAGGRKKAAKLVALCEKARANQMRILMVTKWEAS